MDTTWRQEDKHQGRWLLDLGIHFLASTRYLLGDERIARVAAFTRSARPSLAAAGYIGCPSAGGIGSPGQCANGPELFPGTFGMDGHVVVTEVSVTSKILGREEVKQFTTDILAVPSEVRAPKEQQTLSGRRSKGWQIWNW